MTVIVFRYGVLASDSGTFFDGLVSPWARKVIRGASGNLYGGCGVAACVSNFFEWVESGEYEPEMPLPVGMDEDGDFIILTWKPDWGLGLLTWKGFEDLRGSPYYAVGAGAGVAYGALHHGATAAQAVQAAIAHSTYAAGSVCEVS